MNNDLIARLREMVATFDRSVERVIGISTPRMEGDNLAILLCSYFDNPDQPQEDDTGWSEDATTGFDEVERAIKDHFREASAAINALPDLLDEKERLRGARDILESGYEEATHAPPGLRISVLARTIQSALAALTDRGEAAPEPQLTRTETVK